MNIASGIKNDKWIIAISFVAVLFFTMPFIIHGNYFVDDWLRSENGFSGWEGNGRPLASIVMAVISMSGAFFGVGAIADVFPSSLLPMICIMLLSGYLISLILNIENPLAKIITIISPTINQFWLGNMVFRFDTLIMSLSYLLAVTSVMLCIKGGMKFFMFSIVCTVMMLCLYQASVNVLISLTVAYTGSIIIDRKAISIGTLSCGITQLLALAIGYIIYSKIVISNLELSAYTIKSGEMIKLNAEGFDRLVSNVDSYLHFFISTFDGALFLCLLVMLAFSSLAQAFKLIRTSNYTAFFVCILTPFILIALTFGTLSLLKMPVLQSRVFMSFSIFIAYFAYVIERKKIYFMSYVAYTYFLLIILQSSIVSNVVNDTQRYDAFLAQRIASKLLDNGYKNGTPLIIYGSPKYVPSVSSAISRSPSLKQYAVSAFANHTFKYSLMRQYNILTSTPITDFSGKHSNECRKDSSDVSVCNITGVYIVRI